MWLTSTAKIVYDPYRGSMKRRTSWWCIAEVDKEITRYYRYWLKKELHIHSLIEPAWDAHISVIRGEEPKPELKHLWKKYHGKTVEFKYEHNPMRSKRDDYWTIKVYCPFLLDIRKELERPSNWPLHLSIGKEKY